MKSDQELNGATGLNAGLLNILLVIVMLVMILMNSPLSAYTASTRSGKYHTFRCEYAGKINDRNKVLFKNREKPEKLGYRPCSLCIESPKPKFVKNCLLH